MTTMTNDGLVALARQLGVQTLPLVLSVGPGQDSYHELSRAQERARNELIAGKVLDASGDVDPEVAGALHVLAQPDREIALRAATASGLVRLCIARRGESHVVAIRRGDDLDVHSIWVDGSGDSLARPILDALGTCASAQVAPFSALSARLSESLDEAMTSGGFSNALYRLGAPEIDATAYGLALASCHAHAEVVAYAYTDGATERSPGAVVVYDTARGRIVAAPAMASDQQLWATLTPGTDHRIAQAISSLIEALPGGRWLP
ncbi:ESX secretion-associated protein EspG [Nocardia sp. NBC_01388]|uniref:ESX secretion-associated protein EspG n=1 Tax=Nocardia sp. NBC_01388 TaxID=2903596 RepID=UPI003253194C